MGVVMETVRFAVDDRPFACSDWKLRDKNLTFLRGIDADYFHYAATAHLPTFEGPDKHRAAIAVRVAYSPTFRGIGRGFSARRQHPGYSP